MQCVPTTDEFFTCTFLIKIATNQTAKSYTYLPVIVTKVVFFLKFGPILKIAAAVVWFSVG